MQKENEVIKIQVILNLIQDLQRLPLQLVNNMRGRSRIKYGMTALYTNSAFTLIELLVVVLIIGILATVAVPQYQFAVEKAHSTQALLNLKTIANALEVYYLANEKYPDDLSDLDISIKDNNGWRIVYNKSTYIQMASQRHVYYIALSLPHGTWYRKGYICSTGQATDTNSIPDKICKHLCQTTTLTKVWGSGQVGCFF